MKKRKDVKKMEGQTLFLIGGIILVAIAAGFALNGINRAKRRREKCTRAKESLNGEKSIRAELITQLGKSKEAAEKASSDIIYTKLFNSLADSFQELLGFAASGMDISFYADRHGKKIYNSIREVFRRFNVECKGDVLSIPIEREIITSRILDKVTEYSEDDIKEAITHYKNEVSRADSHKVSKTIIESMSGDLCYLEQTPASEISYQDILNIAQRTSNVLAENGVYPMFVNDPKLESRMDLRGLFVEVNDEAMTIPGLFISINGELYIHGGHQGTCHKGDV